MKNEYKKQTIVMMLCFIIGGFSIIMYLVQGYTGIWGLETFGGTPRYIDNMSIEMNHTLGNNRSFERIPVNPISILTSPFSLMSLINGIILIVAGVSIWGLTRERELGSTKEKITALLLLPEERVIINELKKAKGSLTQSQLVRNTNMSKVKTHRLVNRLAMKGIIKKYPYGGTNKIVLEKDV